MGMLHQHFNEVKKCPHQLHGADYGTAGITPPANHFLTMKKVYKTFYYSNELMQELFKKTPLAEANGGSLNPSPIKQTWKSSRCG